MAEPQSLEILEWVKVVGGAAATAWGTVWSILRGIRKEHMDAVAVVAQRVETVESSVAQQKTDVAVLKANAENHVDRLEEIKDFVKDVSSNVKTLGNQLTEVLMEMRKR